MARTPVLLVLLALLTAGCASDDDDDTDGTDGTTTNTGTTGGGGATVSASASVTGTGAPGNQTVRKTITDDQFPDGTFTIRRGDSVNWTHTGQNPHSVTSRVPMFDSGPACTAQTPDSCMRNGMHFEFEFEVAGTFEYYCRVHPTTMTGTITVTN